MKKKKRKIWSKVVRGVAGIVLGVFLILLVYDNFSDKTKVYKDVITMLQDELVAIKNDFLDYNYDNSKSFNINGNLTKLGVSESISFSGTYKDNNNYEGNIKNLEQDITYSLQNNELYLKKNKDLYKFNLKEEELINIKNMVSNYIFLSDSNFTDIISNIGSISDMLDNKNIIKKRIKTEIDNKNTLATVYSYKLNKEVISKLLSSINIEDIENKDYYILIYTKFNKIKKIEINDIGTIKINDNKIEMDYKIESSSFKISYDKFKKNIDFITYLNDAKVLEYNLNKTDKLEVNLKMYNDNNISKELKFSLEKNAVSNGVNYILDVTFGNSVYKLDVIVNYNDTFNFIDVNNAIVLNEEEVSNINTEVQNSLSNINVINSFLQEFGL